MSHACAETAKPDSGDALCGHSGCGIPGGIPGRRLTHFVFLSGIATASSSLGRRLGLSGLASAIDQAGERLPLAFLEVGDDFAETMVVPGDASQRA